MGIQIYGCFFYHSQMLLLLLKTLVSHMQKMDFGGSWTLSTLLPETLRNSHSCGSVDFIKNLQL